MLISDDRYFRALGASGKEPFIRFEKETISALDGMPLIGGPWPPPGDGAQRGGAVPDRLRDSPVE